jgi:hypothetical protein
MIIGDYGGIAKALKSTEKCSHHDSRMSSWAVKGAFREREREESEGGAKSIYIMIYISNGKML